MMRAAVLGSPILHSLSPRIHKKAYEILGIVADYEAIELDESSFLRFFAENSGATWDGFSLTMPLKEVAFEVTTNIDERTKRINSANTIYRIGTNWLATSTDLLAFDNLLSVSSSAKVAIIGAGGTARAAAGSLNSKISQLDVLLRNPARITGISKAAPDLSINIREMSAPLDDYDLIIQSTPAGAFDNYVTSLKSAEGKLLECLYKPWPTPLASRFTELGGSVISGKELLVEQALFQIKLFTQVEFDLDEMRSALLTHIADS